MKFALILAAALVAAAPVAAQDLVPPPTKAAPAQPPVAVKGAAEPSTPLSGLVVQAPRLKRCGERDKPCQAAVIEEIWKRFPKEIETWCTAVQTRRIRERFALQDLLGDDQLALSASSDFNNTLPDPEKRLCQPAFKARFTDAPFVGKPTQAAGSAAATAVPPSGAHAK